MGRKDGRGEEGGEGGVACLGSRVNNNRMVTTAAV